MDIVLFVIHIIPQMARKRGGFDGTIGELLIDCNDSLDGKTSADNCINAVLDILK